MTLVEIPDEVPGSPGSPSASRYAAVGWSDSNGKRFIITVLVVAMAFLIVGCRTSSGYSLLKLAPADSHQVLIQNLVLIREDPYLERSLDIRSPSILIDLEEIEMLVIVVFGDSSEVSFLKGDFQFDDLRYDLEEFDYEEDFYRGYEVWEGRRYYALLEDEEYIILSDSRSAIRRSLKVMHQGSGSLAGSEDNDLKRIVGELGRAPLVFAAVGEGFCGLRRCRGVGTAFTGYDVSAEEFDLDFAVLFTSERSARIAEEEYDEVTDYLDDSLRVDARIMRSQGDFVLGSGTSGFPTLR